MGAYDPNIVWNEEFKNITKHRLKVLINDHNIKYNDNRIKYKILRKMFFNKLKSRKYSTY